MSHKITRHHAREIALQILYRFDVATQAHGTPPPHGVALLQELTQHFEHFQVPMELREFTTQLVAGSLASLADLDGRLEKSGSSWKVPRMSSVDRSLLRMSVYELLNFPDTPASVIIDEAIELAKQFGTSDSPAFVNGVLDAVRKAQPRE